jgi:hypothetical protein
MRVMREVDMRSVVNKSPYYWSDQDHKMVSSATLANGDGVVVDYDDKIIRYTFYLG